MEFTLLWAALTGVSFAWIGVRVWPDRLPTRPFDIVVGAAAIGLLTGRLAAMTQQGINPFTDPLQIILVRGGVDTGFASLGAMTSLAWVFRHDLHRFDAVAPAALFALAGWHAGCIWRSACLGTASDLPWAWSQSGSSITRHPVELYAAIGLIVIATVVGRLPWRGFMRSGLALAAAGAVRLATEPMRLSLTGGPVSWYVAAIVVGLAAALLGSATPIPVSPNPT